MIAALHRRRVRAQRRDGELPTPTAVERKRAAGLRYPDQRARALLLLHLTPEQQSTWMRHRYITVAGKSGRLYCIHQQDSMNSEPFVYALDPKGRQHVTRYCTHVYGRVPDSDVVLTYLLLLQGDDNQFRKIGQPFTPRPYEQPAHPR